MPRAGIVLNQNSRVQRDWLRAVCFTETPVEHVKLQMSTILGRKLHFQPYGLAFREEAIRNARGNPVFYVETRNSPVWDSFDKLAESDLCSSFRTFLPLVEAFGAPLFGRPYGPKEIDFRWEREWRVVGDFSFTFSDVAFGFCPMDQIARFEAMVGKQFPFVDPTEDVTLVKAKLRADPRLADLK